ncbi:hypothetical protein FOA43_002880 [Brettanomyces nanus]|uniref:PCI domain-containing protein n=1 Tax=Eeniella nana TaxID=13502 RepID=A0A875S593_EENNA|nr:uncharacterized protein FOA43_002880 [Brettanomyces nanus]QPG75525.1 hypothetical protein FOA43_002880 [Brettanomyces nanus]
MSESYLRFILSLRSYVLSQDPRICQSLSFLDHIKDLSSLPDYNEQGLLEKYPPLQILQQGDQLPNIEEWSAIATAYCLLISDLKHLKFMGTISHSAELVNQIVRCAQRETGWICLPMMTVTSELRKLVFIYVQSSEYKAAKEHKLKQSQFDVYLDEKLANLLQKPFKVCLSDKCEDKKFAVYFFANELFKTYMKFGKYDAANNMCKVFQHSPNLPDLSTVSKSQVITYRYFMALVECMNFDRLQSATQLLNQALDACKTGDKYHHNQKASILVLLLPLNFLAHRWLPSSMLWKQYPELSLAFKSIFDSIKEGNLKVFDEEVTRMQKMMLERHVYSLFIRIRPFIELRLFTKVHHFYKGEKPHIIPLSQFSSALKYSSSRDYTIEEVESRLASLIYAGQIKGYISHSNEVIVLSKSDAFPSTM